MPEIANPSNKNMKQKNFNVRQIVFVLLASLALNTHAENKESSLLFSGDRCKHLEQFKGFSNNVTGKATKYSCNNQAVGIALYAGKDLGKHPPEKIAKYFVDQLAERKVSSKVFIKHNHKHGSSMAFYINGDSWLTKAKRPSEAVKMIDNLAAETKLVYLIGGRKQPNPVK